MRYASFSDTNHIKFWDCAAKNAFWYRDLFSSAHVGNITGCLGANGGASLVSDQTNLPNEHFETLKGFYFLLLIPNYLTLRNCWEWITFLLLSPVSKAASFTLSFCFILTVSICGETEPSVVHLWSDSSSLTGFGHFENMNLEILQTC